MKQLIYLLLIVSTTTIAQVNIGCFTPSTTQSTFSNLNATSCGVQDNYTPYPVGDYTPLKTVRISFHTMLRSNGSSNYVGSEQNIKDFYQKIIDEANVKYATNQIPNPNTGSPLIVDTRIRFVINKFYFYKSDSVYKEMEFDSLKQKTVPMWDEGDHDATWFYNNIILTNTSLSNIDKNKTLHFIMSPYSNSTYLGGRSAGFANKKYIFMRAYDIMYNLSVQQPSYYNYTYNTLSGHVVHETGHALGLYHTFQPDDCADNNSATLASGTTNNFMDYFGGQWHPAVAFSQCQIAKMHYALMGNLGDIAEDVVDEYCAGTFTPDITIPIGGSQVLWSAGRNLSSNLIVNGNLKIQCNTSIPFGKNITINSGGKLYIDQADIINKCAKPHAGIIINDGGYLSLSATNVNNYTIYVRAGGSLHITGQTTLLNASAIVVEDNGYICVGIGKITLQDPASNVYLATSSNKAAINSVVGITSYACNYIAVGTAPNSTVTGLGQVIIGFCANDIKIQNEIITTRQFRIGNNLLIGANVNTALPTGKIEVQDNARLELKACQNVEIYDSFEIMEGAEMEVK